MQPLHINDHITHTVEDHLSKRPRRSYPKACHPCRRRKIRCNNAQPCASCISHEYPELCFYTVTEAERKVLRQRRRRNEATCSETNGKGQSPAARLSRLLEFEKGLKILEEPALAEPASSVQPEECLRPFSDSVRKSNEGVTHGPTTVSSAATSIGSGRERPTHQHLDDRRIRTPATSDVLYMVDTGNIHPFENLWHPGSTVREISLALPSDEIFTRY